MGKKQIHPLIDDEDDIKLKYFNIKPSEALKEYVKILSSGNKKIDNDIHIKQEIIKSLKAQRQIIDNDITRLEKEIEQLEQDKEKETQEGLSDYEKAKQELDKRFDKITKQLENNGWNIQKVKIKELESIAKEYGIPPSVLLNSYKLKDLKKVLENPRKYKS